MINVIRTAIIVICLFTFYYVKSYYKSIESMQQITNSKIYKNNIDIYVLYISKREKYIKNIINKLFINTIYYTGINKINLNKKKLIEDKLVTLNYANSFYFNNGRVACHLGHINILKKFMEGYKQYCLVLEDDINIRDDDIESIKYKLANILDNIPKDADIVYLSYCWEQCYFTKKNDDIFDKSYRPLCRHIYLVSRKGADSIIKNTIPMYMNGDQMYADLIKRNILKAYNVDHNYLNISQNRGVLGSNLNNGNEVPPPCDSTYNILHHIYKEGVALL